MATEPNPRPYKVQYDQGNFAGQVRGQIKGFRNDRERSAWIKSQGSKITNIKKFMG